MSTDIAKIMNEYNEESPRKKTDVSSGAKDNRNKELYILWCSIPMIIKQFSEEELKKLEYPTDDPVFMRMLRCTSQAQFCKAFGLDKNRPTIWRKRDPEIETRIATLSNKTNVLRYEKDIDLAFTSKTAKHGDAARVKLWKQIYKGYSEKSNVELSGQVTTLQELVMSLEEGD